MDAVMTELAKKEWGNVLVVQMEASPAAFGVAKNDFQLALKVNEGLKLILAPQISKISASGSKETKLKASLDDLTKWIHSN